MREFLRRWYLVGLALAGVALSVLAWPRLPAELAVHWDVHGTPNGFMPRAVGAFLLPATLLLLGSVMRALPAIDPRQANYARFSGAYELTIAATMVLLLLIHGCILAAGVGIQLPIVRLATAFAGGLFVVIGNVLPRSRSNFWYGIRTPWTLSSDRVWARTHRVAGFAMTGAGLSMLAAAVLLPPAAGIILVIGGAVAATVVPAVYSWFTWKHEPLP